MLVLEEASLELLPMKLQTHASARRVEEHFGVRPERQILDSNFHRTAMSALKDSGKRGRPDVVHFALLDATSTPLFMRGRIKVVMHTIGGETISLKSGTRPPRNLQRFCGVVSKLLSSEQGEAEERLFKTSRKQTFSELLSSLGVERVVTLTKLGIRRQLDQVVQISMDSEKTAWVVGGFAHGHFESDVTAKSTEVISISQDSLAAHVVTSRLCYELEQSFGI